MKGLRIITALALIGAVAIPSLGRGAEGTLDCKCKSHYHPANEWFPEYWNHSFDATYTGGYKCDTPGCHESTRLSFCSYEHEGCGATLLIAIDEAAESVPALLQFVMHDRVFVNSSRNAIQVLDCNGQVMQSAKLRDDDLKLLAGAIALKYFYA